MRLAGRHGAVSVCQQPPAEPPQLFNFGEAAAAVRCPVLLLYAEGAVAMLDAMGLDMAGRRRALPALFAQAADVAVRSIAEGSVFVINACAAQWAALVHEHLTSSVVAAFAKGSSDESGAAAEEVHTAPPAFSEAAVAAVPPLGEQQSA